MHHVALDRAGPHDGHLDHQVVKAPGRSRGSMVIWARLSIWKTPIVSARLDHVVDRRVFRGDGGQRQLSAAVLGDQVETLADRGEHAQGQAVDFEDAQGVQIVLVPLDDGAVGHGGVFDGHEFAERAAAS